MGCGPVWWIIVVIIIILILWFWGWGWGNWGGWGGWGRRPVMTPGQQTQTQPIAPPQRGSAPPPASPGSR